MPLQEAGPPRKRRLQRRGRTAAPATRLLDATGSGITRPCASRLHGVTVEVQARGSSGAYVFVRRQTSRSAAPPTHGGDVDSPRRQPDHSRCALRSHLCRPGRLPDAPGRLALVAWSAVSRFVPGDERAPVLGGRARASRCGVPVDGRRTAGQLRREEPVSASGAYRDGDPRVGCADALLGGGVAEVPHAAAATARLGSGSPA
jgi:hypothetical protein